MYVAIVHRTKDPQAMLSHGEAVSDPSNAPQGIVPRQFCPSQDLSQATCIWKGGSVEAVRDYVDSTLRDASDNTYCEISTEYAQGLPEPATAQA